MLSSTKPPFLTSASCKQFNQLGRKTEEQNILNAKFFSTVAFSSGFQNLVIRLLKILISSCPFFLHHLCVFLLLSLRLPIRLSHSTYLDERGTVKYLPQVKNTKQHSLESMRTLCLLLLLYLGIGTDIFNHHRYPINEKQSLIVVIIN